ncbi:hypothetical protein AJ79_04406 [Helicocarpus griseus UAMH5409]|uniref:Extracellular membrane protein CFEM domain-containing protein n=1 Tax=Helicocarpus griseus UAMH5409 TaxID=1447875 RepID=A0A2B7XSN7_9EURO|nr:hypothetical protein AJ79_04406 [Helicocarpus griseus UAMH5409]
MRLFPIALLGLASVAVAEFKTWNDVMGDVPECVKKCYGDWYNSTPLKEPCGSPDKATMDCICKVPNIKSDTMTTEQSMDDCLKKDCTGDDLEEITAKREEIQKRLEQFKDQCASGSGALSVSPNFNGVMLASGALLIAGAAL